jgi:hypothetical protein
MARILYVASALAAAAGVAIACGDDPVGPTDREVVVPLAATDLEREQMRVALSFAGERSVLALENRMASEPLAQSLISLAQRVERNDRAGVERGVSAARVAMDRYRELAGGDSAVDPDLEAMALTLDFAAQLAGRTQKPSADRVGSSESSSHQERQP